VGELNSPPPHEYTTNTLGAGTAQTTCAAPIGGGANYANVTIFCTSTYNSTTCEQIQQEAQDDLAIFSWFMLTFFGVVGCLICLLIIVLTRFVKLLVNNKSIIVESEVSERNTASEP